jgi:hypothetical protein
MMQSISRRQLLLPACGEKVGMRGPLRWVRSRGGVCNAVACTAPLRIAERPPHPPPDQVGGRPLPAQRGEVNKQSRSRGRESARECCQTAMSNIRSPHERSDMRVRSRSFNVHPGCRFAHPGYEEIRKAERRQTHCRQFRTKRVRSRHGRSGLRRPSALGRARLPAFHHGSRQGDLRHPRRNPGHASWDAV